MTRHFYQRVLSLLLLMLLNAGFLSYSHAQLSGVKIIPTDYATIAAFVLDVNTQGVGPGGVTLNVPSGHTETAPVTGIQLTATGTAGSPIVIQKDGFGINPLITAGSGGIGTPSLAIQDGVFALIGSDYVTIDGIDINDPNTVNPATMEWGYGLFKASSTDGCQNNIIRNCTITLNRVNNAAGTTTSFDGSKGINMTNALINTQTTVVTVTSPAGSNSFNQFYSNTIQNVNLGIVLAGFADVTPFANADTGNDIGGNSVLTGNTIVNFGGGAAATNPAAGVRTSSQYNLNVSFNTVNNNNGSGVNHVSTLRGILIGAAVSASATLNNNTVTVVSGAATSLMEGISNASGSTAAGNTVNINNNTVRIAYPSATSGTANGILNSGTPTTLNVNGNTITNVSSLPAASNVLAGTGTMLMIDCGSPATLNMNNNTVSNLTRTGTSGTFRAMRITSPANATISGNTVENLSYTTVTSTGSIDGFYSLSSAVNVTVENNLIRNLSTPTTGTINGIREFGVAGNKVITNNQVYGFSTTLGGAGGATFNGIYCSTGTVTISGNTVYALNSTGTTGGTGGIVTGIWSSSSSTPWNIFKNRVYGLSTNSSGTGTLVNGILASSGGGNIYNNLVGDLTVGLGNGTDAIRGISLTSSTAASNIGVFYNSIYLNAVATGTNFGSTGIFHTGSVTATTAALNMRNNIIINESAPNGTGLNVAFRRGTANAANMAATTNNNLLYAGVPGANKLIYSDGTTPQQTLAGYQTVVLPVGHDLNSMTGEATFTGAGYGAPGNFFISLSGSANEFLQPVTAIVTQVESGAQNISAPSIVDDYLSVTRAGNAGYSGLGSNPDIGAYEFDGVSPAPTIVLNSVTPPASAQCVSSSRLVSVEVTTLSGTITGANLFHSINGVPQAAIAMTNAAGNTWTGTIPAPSPVNATIVWAVTASNSIGLNSSYNGTTYSDEPLTGYTANISSSVSTVCAGSPSTLLATLSNSNVQTYTPPTAVSNALLDEDLKNITITQGATTVLNNTSNYNSLVGTLGTATGTAGSIANYTSFPPSTLQAGQNYDLSATVVDSNDLFYYQKGVGVFIDYNRNGLFNDPGENVYTSPVSPAPQTAQFTFTGSFTVPANVSNGLTRMRVVVNEGLVTGPTMIVSYGEFEEYSILLAGATAGITAVSWSDGVSTVGTTNPITINPTVTTTYTATITAFGCPFSPEPTTTITVNPLPSAPTATNSLQCGTQIPTASVTSTSGLSTPTFKWYDAPVNGAVLQNSTSSTYTSNVTATSTFYVSELNATTGCESARTAVTVTVQTADNISATAALPSTICIGGSVTLNAANTSTPANQNYTYTWTGTAGSGLTAPVNGSSITVTPTLAGSYIYNLSGVDGGCNAVAQVSVTVDPFVATVSPVAATCNGVADGTFTLGTSTCGTLPYTYSVDGGTTFTPIPTNLAAGSYTVIVKDANNFTTTGQSITITEPSTTISVPTVTNASVCVNDLIANVTGTSFTSVPTPGSVTVTFNLAAQPTELSATSFPATVAAGPNSIMTATMPALPAGATITGATFTYPGLTALGGSWRSDIGFGFTGSVNAGYASSVGAANSAGVFDYSRALAAGTITGAGGAVNVHYFDLYNDNAGAEATFPTGNAVATLVINYTTPTPATVTWWDAPTGGNQVGNGATLNAVGTSVLPNTTTPGNYTLYAQGQNGACPSPSRATATVTVNVLPLVDAGFDQTVCAGGTVTLSATGANTYSWSPTAQNGVSFVPSTTGIYTVIGVNTATGCSNTDLVAVTVNALPVVNAGLDTAICFGQGIVLNGAGASTYAWNNGVTNGISFNPSTTATYTVTGTDANGCTNDDSLVLTVNALPSISAGLDTSVCSTSLYTLSGSGGVSYTWNNGVQNGVAFSVIATTVYTVTGLDANGCQNTDDVQITSLTLPAVGAGADFSACLNDSVSLTGTGAVSYTWDNNVSDGVPFVLSGTTTFFVTGTDANGCENVDTVVVTANPIPVVNAGIDVEQCEDQNVTLTATGGISYNWTNGVQNGVSFQSPFGITVYSVTGTDANGCSNTDDVQVTINTAPVAAAILSNAVNLTAAPLGATYQWIDCSNNSAISGATDSVFTATQNSSYAVVVTIGGGCSDTSDCVVVDQVGLDANPLKTGITVYPNPTLDYLFVKFIHVDNLSVIVYDFQGKEIMQFNSMLTGDKIDLSRFDRGVYTIQFTDTEGRKTTERVIKD